MLRMVNVRDGDWDLTDLKYSTLDDAAETPYRLETGDILFNRTNSKELVGKCAVFREEGEWIFASYLIRVRVSDAQYLPDFLARFLNSDVGRAQIDRVSRRIIGMANINATEIRTLKVPRPPRTVQQKLVRRLQEEWAKRQAHLSEVRKLLAAGDAEIAERLSLTAPVVEGQLVWAATRADMASSQRLNANFFHPERVETVRTIATAKTAQNALIDVADFVRDHVLSAAIDDYYVGLANVERDTGELVDVGFEELPESACVRFQPGDVLYGKLRPYLNKVHLAERSGICSPEFLVLRAKGDRVRPEYLAAILRSQLVLAQTRHMTTGNTHPRLTLNDVRNLVIPRPDMSIQDRIAEVEAENRTKARALKIAADREWRAEKQHFGDDLVMSLDGP
jgi:type I restriction enzyme, S subunit